MVVTGKGSEAQALIGDHLSQLCNVGTSTRGGMLQFIEAPDKGPIHIDHPATVSMEGFKECTSLLDEIPVGSNVPGNMLMGALCLPRRGPHIPEE